MKNSPLKSYAANNFKFVSSNKKNTVAIIDPEAGNYEKHPFFVKKANEAKALLKAAGLPRKLSKAK